MLKLGHWIFDSVIGKALAAAAALASLLTWYTMEQRAIGARDARVEIERKARENVKRAENVRGAVRSGAAERLRDPYAND